MPHSRRLAFAAAMPWLIAALAGCTSTTASICTTYGFALDSSSPVKLRYSTSPDTNLSVAQSFTFAATHTLKSMTVPLTLTGSFTASLYSIYLTIESDNGFASTPADNNTDGPSGTALATSESIDPSTLSSTQTAELFTLATPVSLTAGTVYWLRLNANYPQGTANYVSWGGYVGTDYYTSGESTLETSSDVFSNVNLGPFQSLEFAPTCSQ